MSDDLEKLFRIPANTRIRVNDTRRDIKKQYDALEKLRDKPDANYTFEQMRFFITEMNALLKTMADLQKHAAVRRPSRGKKGTGRPRGRPRKNFDAEGIPLYQDSPKPVKSEDDNSKAKFLQEITSEPEETE